jgi:hypothetical protein
MAEIEPDGSNKAKIKKGEKDYEETGSLDAGSCPVHEHGCHLRFRG